MSRNRIGSQRSTFWLVFSETDERYLDLTRILLAIAVLTLTGLAISQEARGESVDLLALGSAYAALLVGGGIGIGGRARLEDGNPMHGRYGRGNGIRDRMPDEPDEWGLP